MAGVTFAMKNMYGVVDKPFTLHADNCNPGVADLNCIPVIRDKVRFTIGDAMSSVYDGGPGFHPERLWYPNALIVGEDRVALDHIAWEMLETQARGGGHANVRGCGPPAALHRHCCRRRAQAGHQRSAAHQAGGESDRENGHGRRRRPRQRTRSRNNRVPSA